MKYKIIFVLMILVSSSIHAATVLVDTDWLASNIGKPGISVVDMSGDHMQYLRFHLPGAIRIGYDEIVKQRSRKERVSVRLSDQELIALLGLKGITRDSHVVVYDDTGGLNAGRLLWDLERIGHKKVSVLNGGLVKWIREGRKIEFRPVAPKKVAYNIGKGGRDNEIDINGMVNIRDKKNAVMLDVRTKEEYIGHPRYPRSGHIPGAKWWPWDNTLDIEGGFTLKSQDGITKSLQSVGVKDKDKPVALYCRSGHRAAQSYLVLRSLGYDKVKLYDGSMAEYGSRKDQPLTKGLQP